MDGVTVRRATTWGIHMSCQQRVHRNQYCSVDQSEVENIISHIRIQRMAVFGHTVSDCLPMLHGKLPVITQCRVQQPLPVMCRNQSINQSVIIPLCLRERSWSKWGGKRSRPLLELTRVGESALTGINQSVIISLLSLLSACARSWSCGFFVRVN